MPECQQVFLIEPIGKKKGSLKGSFFFTPKRLRQVSYGHSVLLQRTLDAELIDSPDHPGRKLHPHVTLLAGEENPAGLKVCHKDVVGLVVRVAHAVAVLAGGA